MKLQEKDGIYKLLNCNQVHPTYAKSLENTLNKLGPIFQLAMKKNQFQFGLALLGVKSFQDAGWEPFETLREIHKIFSKVKKNLDGKELLHISLFFYGVAVEASEPYEIIANLFNIIEGKPYIRDNFPDERTKKGFRQIYPIEKIEKLKERAAKLNFSLDFYDNFFDNKLRNAVFHSNYNVHNEEIRFSRRGQDYVYNRDTWIQKVNGAYSYYESIIFMLSKFKKEFASDKLLDAYPHFSKIKGEKGVPIIRKGHGLIGVKDNWTEEEKRKGRIPWWIGRSYKYEKILIEKGQHMLPVDKVKKYNLILNYCPNPIKSWLASFFNRKLEIK